MISRRFFLKAGALALVTTSVGGVPAFVTRAAQTQKNTALFRKNKVLICIFQRGAMDGLMAVTPYNDEFLKKARPDLFISPAKSQNNPLIDLDGRFGLHPSLSPFESLFKENRLAIVHGVGSPNNTRSHFDAQDYMESGTPFKKGTPSGWLNRASGLLGHEAISPFQAVSITDALPRSLYGDNPAIAISNLADFNIKSKEDLMSSGNTSDSFESLYDHSDSELINKTGKETFEAMKILKDVDTKNYRPDNQAVYPASSLGNSLKQIAQLIKMNVGMEIAFAECGGWDTHFNQGTGTGTFARNIGDFGKSIVAFWNDLEMYQDEIEIVTMTEFGRTVRQNGTRGTDHGRGSCMFIIGNDINGGKVHGSVPELSIENLEDERDVPVTTDFRAVFEEVSTTHLGFKSNNVLFPGWDGKGIGLMKHKS